MFTPAKEVKSLLAIHSAIRQITH